MTSPTQVFDATVIGGGFYGAAIAIYLAGRRGLPRVLLLEREPSLLARASYHNQARVHNGYHYPRSFTTAFRSRVNLPQFVRDWPHAVTQDFTKLYAIARRNSKVTARQFERFCRDIGATIQRADDSLHKLFEPRLIEEVFLVEEYAFNAKKLAEQATRELQETGVHVWFSSCAKALYATGEGKIRVSVQRADGTLQAVESPYVFNCTYSGLNQLEGDFPGVKTGLKQEITEMALVRMPAPLAELGITVMDGPFFSMMPFPARGLHTLSHVRYTPHTYWMDARGINPYARLSAYPQETRFDRMLRDVARYIPSAREMEYAESIFEVKTVLQKNEADDGRPILWEKHEELPGCYSILGGKIDNIYDVMQKLDTENLFIKQPHTV